MTEYAPGIPAKKDLGDISRLKPGLVEWVVQHHLAERAGPHYDIRLGTPETGLLSWAAKKGLPEPGGKHLAVQQPVHTVPYAEFEGQIPSGYGAGEVRKHDRGKVLVLDVKPNKISFVVAHKRFPEYFTLVKPEKFGERDWLLVNTTPTEVVENKKVRYKKVPAEEIDKLFDQDYLASEKIDGASALIKFVGDDIQVLSYRPSKAGRPIVHTLRLAGTPLKADVPPGWKDRILRGEIYGVRKSTGEAIPPQELGGILNASLAEAVRKVGDQDVDMRVALFDVAGEEDKPYEARLAVLKEALKFLPKERFHLPQVAQTPEEMKDLWKRISGGKHPTTREGMIFHHRTGGPPIKVKLRPEAKVYVRDIFPGGGQLEGAGAGGFTYSLEEGGPEIGRVGTGFDVATRKAMMENPEEWRGRIARIASQERFPSGAYRAPSFIALHEDYTKLPEEEDEKMDKAASTEEKDLTPYRNGIKNPIPTGGNPSRPSNATLMKYLPNIERYSAGHIEDINKVAQDIYTQGIAGAHENLYPDAGENAAPGVQQEIDKFRAQPEEERDKPLLYHLLGEGTPDFKMSKADAEYQEEPNGDQKCANCNFAYKKVAEERYICSQIEGDIKPEAWCKLWKGQEQKKEAADTPGSVSETVTIEGKPECVGGALATLGVMAQLGQLGSSRDIVVPVDGDGPFFIKVKPKGLTEKEFSDLRAKLVTWDEGSGDNPRVDTLSEIKSLKVGDQEKRAGEEREPEVDDHVSAPVQKMRPRSELVLFNRRGCYCIDHGDYLMFPGGGIDDGEQPRDAAIRETIEESGRHPINVDPAGTVEAVWPKESGNDFWDDSDFDGERTYFFIGVDSGDSGVDHPDMENFSVMGFDKLISRLEELIDREDQAWAKRNNEERLGIVRRAKRLVRTEDGLRPRKHAQAAMPQQGMQTPAEQVGVPIDPSRKFVEELANQTPDDPSKVPTTPALPMQQNTGPMQQQPGPVPTPSIAQPQPGTMFDTPSQQPELRPNEQMKAAADRLMATFIKSADIPELTIEGEESFVPETAPLVNTNVQTGVFGGAQAADQIVFAQRDPIEQAEIHTKAEIKRALAYCDLLDRIYKTAAMSYEEEQAAGAKEELEHTEDPEEAEDIAEDHLEEDPNYYDKLDRAGLLEEESKEGQQKAADVAQLIPRRQYIMFTPDGKVIARRAQNRRFVFPEEGTGKPVPYESSVRFVPEAGVPEPGAVGYDIGLRIGESPEVPAGYEAIPTEALLKDLYASMGLATNKPFRALDRARARAILRWVKRRKKERERNQLPVDQLPVAPPSLPESTPFMPPGGGIGYAAQPPALLGT